MNGKRLGKEGESTNKGFVRRKMVGGQLGKRVVCWKHVGRDVQRCNVYVNGHSSSVSILLSFVEGGKKTW